VTTPEARTVIHGTLVSVLRNDAVTCVCLFEGSAEVLTEKAALGEVPRGMRWVMFRDGSDPQLMEIMPAHQDHMLGLDAACATIFDKP
jgi:ferric-dicitrate binding protein FerR (iron transport regulator)